jgi:cysteinyl-tRNA synthetase
VTETTDHPIRLRNTLTRRVERFVPADPKNVRMYVCGPTVYDRAHLGNARSAVVFDVLFRLLRHVYGEDHVTYVRNITDIDDKIIARAKETGRPVEEITEETTRWYHEDMDALGCLRPTDVIRPNGMAQMIEPRATQYLPQMIAMTRALIEKGHAYEAEGHVLFAVQTYEEYGRLSGRSTEDMIAGARVEVAPYKRHPMDFVLWKPSGEGVPGWDSPWGLGRPGWHIECSAMARDLLGGAFDIHGGGLDLQFPHHENEIAQSRCAHPDEGFAKVWVHNEMLRVEGEKMSKSLGNFLTVRDLLDQHISGGVIRLALLLTHYGKPADWTASRVEESNSHLQNWSRFKHYLERYSRDDLERAAPPDESLVSLLCNDLNTPGAVGQMHRVSHDAQVARQGDISIPCFFASARLLGLEIENPDEPRRSAEARDVMERAFDEITGWQPVMKKTIGDLLKQRDEARRARDFARADTIRESLSRAGVSVRDTPTGAKWEIGIDFDASELEKIK